MHMKGKMGTCREVIYCFVLPAMPCSPGMGTVPPALLTGWSLSGWGEVRKQSRAMSYCWLGHDLGVRGLGQDFLPFLLSNSQDLLSPLAGVIFCSMDCLPIGWGGCFCCDQTTVYKRGEPAEPRCPSPSLWFENLQIKGQLKLPTWA
jgi:hypothetical protein